MESTAQEWRDRDLDVRQTLSFGKHMRLLVYTRFESSAALVNEALLEFRIGCTAIHRHGGFLFVGDSSGAVPGSLRGNHAQVPAQQLVRLLSGPARRVTQLSLMSSDLGPHSIRRKTLHAHSMAATAPGLADPTHFYTTALGYYGQRRDQTRRRYLGFTRGRVSDSHRPVRISEWCAWCHDVAAGLEGGEGPDVMNRYARPARAPKDPSPQNVLFDLDEVIDLFVLQSGHTERPVRFEELCYPVRLDGGIDLQLGGRTRPYEATLRFDSRRYQLSCEELEETCFARIDGRKADNLVAYINREQLMRVVPKDFPPIYGHGRFYAPRDPLVEKLVLEVITADKALGPATEKGAPGTANENGWDPTSVFGWIDAKSELSKFEWLVCDDLHTEVADFIAADSRGDGRVVFAHAKGFKEQKKRSASAFQEVCAQALKNLDYLTPQSQNDPPNLNRWSKRWKVEKYGNGPYRIRRPAGRQDPREAWEAIRAVIRNPRARREVWIVVGGGLQKHQLENVRSAGDAFPEMIQILYLLQSTWSAVGSIGGTLRVLCSP